MHIDVHIPFDRHGRLAAAYNRALRQSTSEWVLFLDHDVFLCNPFWYDMCLTVAHFCDTQAPKAACIGCVCGGEHHRGAMREFGPPDSDIENHIAIAKQRYAQYGTKIERIYEHSPGYFLLLKRQIAIDVGFKRVGKTINNVDRYFGERLLEAGHHIYQMNGLYIYHRRGMKHLKKEFKQ